MEMSKIDYGESNNEFTNDMELQYIRYYSDEENTKEAIEMANYLGCNLSKYEEFLNSPESDKLYEAYQSYINNIN